MRYRRDLRYKPVRRIDPHVDYMDLNIFGEPLELVEHRSFLRRLYSRIFRRS